MTGLCKAEILEEDKASVIGSDLHRSDLPGGWCCEDEEEEENTSKDSG